MGQSLRAKTFATNAIAMAVSLTPIFLPALSVRTWPTWLPKAGRISRPANNMDAQDLQKNKSELFEKILEGVAELQWLTA